MFRRQTIRRKDNTATILFRSFLAAKLSTMASALGMTLGRLRLITDSSSVAYNIDGSSAAGHFSALARVRETPISAQLITIRADAGVDYSLAP